MKSFAIAAFAGAASAAWAPPAYGGQSSAPVAASSAAPAEGYSQPIGYETSSAPAAPAYEETSAPAYGESTSASQPIGYSKPTSSFPVAPTGNSKSSSIMTMSSAYGTGSIPAYTPKPTGSYGGGNETGGWGGDEYVTQVVTKLTTVCPSPTTLTQNGKEYTVTESTTLTIEDCPCTQEVPATSYKPEMTTEVVTSFTTTCPGQTTATFGPSTYTISQSTVLTVTDCGDSGCTVSKEVPGTFVVPTYTSVLSPSAPTTVTIGTQTYDVSTETTIVATAPTSYVTETSVSEGSTVTVSKPIQGYLTVTAPISNVYSAPPAASTPVAPVPGQPSAGYPAPSGYTPPSNGSSPVSPNIPEQTGNGAGKLMAGGAAFGAAVAAFFL